MDFQELEVSERQDWALGQLHTAASLHVSGARTWADARNSMARGNAAELQTRPKAVTQT
ncbi:Uncharacterized protein DAT39_007999, partial [Clarias magur]